MNKFYYRLTKSVNDKGELYSEDTVVETLINNPDRDWYKSIYYYNQEQHDRFYEEVLNSKTGMPDKRGCSGILDVVTDRLVWDLDAEDQVELALQDTKTLTKRLNDAGIAHQIFFSGNKGFGVEAELDTHITVKQFASYVDHFASDLKTFDTTIRNASRILRICGTKHEKTGKYKTQIFNIEEITLDEILIAANSSFIEEKSHINKTEILPKIKKASEILPKTVFRDSEFNVSAKPKWLSNWKYAIMEGYFPPGTRHHSLMALGATLKNQGMNKLIAYRVLKGALELQCDRFDSEKYNKEEVWRCITDIFDPNWNGGTYSEDDFPSTLKDYFDEQGIARFSGTEDPTALTDINSAFDDFGEYAKNIDENSISFGLPELDKVLKTKLGYLTGLLAPPGVGKCLKFDTDVLMFDGSIKKVQDIKIGHQIMGDDSNPRNILSLARGKETMYRIETDDSSYTVNESHIISLKTTNNDYAGYPKGSIINITVKDYLEKSENFKRRTMGYRVPIEFKEKKVEFSPYLVASWIGDGSKRSTTITHNDLELCDYYEYLANKNGLIYRLKENKDRAYSHLFTTETGQKNPFRVFLRENCISKDNEKSIPREYIINSRKNRLEFLAGLIDTDGYYSKEKDSYEYTCKEKHIAEDIRFLCRSLGIKATLKKIKKGIASTGFEGEYYRLYIVGDLRECPIRLKRRIPKNLPKQNSPTEYRIKVFKEDVDDYYGFEIDGNKLFLLGDFTVTHNTSMALTILSNTSKQGLNSIFFSYDMYKNVLIQKVLQRETGFTEDDLYDIYRSGDQEQIEKFRMILKKHYANVDFCFKSSQSMEELRSSIYYNEQKTGEKIKLVVVDYLELVKAKVSDPTQASMEIIQGLREIANEGRVVMILLQPNKMSSKVHMPLLSYNGAKGSSSIAQAVTQMLTCHRPGMSSLTPQNDNYFGINIVKNRMGVLAAVDFHWTGLTGKIRKLEDAERAELKDLRAILTEAEKDDRGGL